MIWVGCGLLVVGYSLNDLLCLAYYSCLWLGVLVVLVLTGLLSCLDWFAFELVWVFGLVLVIGVGVSFGLMIFVCVCGLGLFWVVIVDGIVYVGCAGCLFYVVVCWVCGFGFDGCCVVGWC